VELAEEGNDLIGGGPIKEPKGSPLLSLTLVAREEEEVCGRSDLIVGGAIKAANGSYPPPIASPPPLLGGCIEGGNFPDILLVILPSGEERGTGEGPPIGGGFKAASATVLS
jgi:hypothetical protein